MTSQPAPLSARFAHPEAPRALILTAIPGELKAVIVHLENSFEYDEPRHGYVYECGEFSGEHHLWNVVVAQTTPGNIDAALAAKTIIEHVSPELVIFVGIAGGLKGYLQLGDVIASSKIYFCEAGKSDTTFLTRPECMLAPERLEQRASMIVAKGQWVFRIKPTSPTIVPKAHLGPIAATEGVLSNTASPKFALIRDQYSDALAVEMEGFGIMKGAFHCGVHSIVVRGISDKIDGKAEADQAGAQDIAAAHASAFAFEMLFKMTIVPKARDLSVQAVLPAQSPKPTENNASSVAVNDKWVIELDGDLSQLNETKQADLIEAIKRVSGDLGIRIEKIETGSIILHLSGQADSFEKVAKLFKEGNLQTLVNFRTKAVLDLPTYNKKSQIVSSLKLASKSLMDWPTTVESYWLTRREMGQIEERLRTLKESTMLLLGDPGTGKSALLAKMAKMYIDQGQPVLGIKADYVDPTVDSPEKLGQVLGLPFTPHECVRTLSSYGEVFVFIDQLDALADLVDLHSQRLNVLLDFIKYISKLPNVHIVASCRKFEHNHDIRLASIEAEEIVLNPPAWEEISKLLLAKSIDSSKWPPSFQQILLVPLHLKIFLELLGGPDEIQIIESYQSLFERLWDQRILNPSGPSGRSDLLTQMAIEMADNEILWLPTAKYEEYKTAIDGLEAAGILRRTEDKKRVGFSHQKLFEYARARAFAKTGESLATFVLSRQEGLFVRPKLWTSLVYLRSADLSSYKAEFGKIWRESNLRLHIRHLLIEFLAEVSNPDEQEIKWLFEYLIKPEFRGKVLVALSGKKTWFEHIGKSLPMFMNLPESEAWPVVSFLSQAWTFAKSEVMQFIAHYWGPHSSKDQLTFRVLQNLNDWDEPTVNLLCKIIERTEVPVSVINIVASTVSVSVPDLAVKVVAAGLKKEFAKAKQRAETIATADSSSESRDIDYERRRFFTAIFEQTTEWYDVSEVASAAPKTFIRDVWPIFVQILENSVATKAMAWKYREDWSLSTELEGPGEEFWREYPLITAIEESVKELAKRHPSEFLALVKQFNETDVLLVQRLLARGLIEIVSTHHDAGLKFLLNDPRRLALGSHRDTYLDSNKLISSLVPFLSREDIGLIENAIVNWRADNLVSEKEPKVRFDLMQYNRIDRLRLLRAIPKAKLSSATKALLEEEERAFPTYGKEFKHEVIEVGFVGSPMSLEQMEKARDEDILRLFHQLEDKTEWDHPKKFMRGGNIQASRVLADLVKKKPERGLGLIKKFSPGTQERPVAHALQALAATGYSSEELFSLIRELDHRGFSKEEFRAAAASALAQSATNEKGLSDQVCRFLNNWLSQEWSIVDADKDSDKTELAQDSILWGHNRIRILPQGTYTVLEAIFKGLMFRTPMAADQWLMILKEHLMRNESVVTWKAMAAFQLEYLGSATDRKAAIQFFEELFAKYPALRDAVDGVILIAKIGRWIPIGMLKDLIHQVGRSQWNSAPQAYGELLPIAYFNTLDDELRSELDQIFENQAVNIPLQEVKLGVAYSVVSLWTEPAFRKEATSMLIRLIPDADDVTSKAIMGVFSKNELPPDQETVDLLTAIQLRPSLLKATDPYYLLARLQELLPFNPTLVYDVCKKLLETLSKEFADMRTSIAHSSSELINIALTLHRYTEAIHRTQGLELFEQMLYLNLYGAKDALHEIDGRPISASVARALRRRKKKVSRK